MSNLKWTHKTNQMLDKQKDKVYTVYEEELVHKNNMSCQKCGHNLALGNMIQKKRKLNVNFLLEKSSAASLEVFSI